MTNIRSILTVFGYALVSMLSMALIAGVVVASWRFARPENGEQPSRLRWHVVAKTRISKGTQIKEEDVTWALARIAAEARFVPVSKMAVGKYALSDIEFGARVTPEMLSELALAEPPASGAVIPVEVKSEDACGLKPGMQLAFVQDKQMLPARAKSRTRGEPALSLLSVTTSRRDAAVTTLTIQVDKGNMDLVPRLATGQWRPVILGTLEPPGKAEKKQERAARTVRRGRAGRRRTR